MDPYVVRENDHLLKLAHKLGFDADDIWNDASNSDLRQLRSDPNILLAGDLLHVPPQSDAKAHPLTVGATNSFTSCEAPQASISVKLVNDDDDQKYASRAYTITELPDLANLTSDGGGVHTFQVPVTLETATIVFIDNGESLTLQIGGMDPIETMSGVFKRLQNLGYLDWTVDYDSINLDSIREAMRGLRASLGADADGDAGIRDDGTLSDETKTMLTGAHGY